MASGGFSALAAKFAEATVSARKSRHFDRFMTTFLLQRALENGLEGAAALHRRCTSSLPFAQRTA
jgi:hypothetical protein